MLTGISKELMAIRAAREVPEGGVVNLGIGLPTMVSQYLDPSTGVFLQAENGILGYGRVLDPATDVLDPDAINAGGQPVEILPGASFFDSVESFAMIRGGHIDLAILGGLQVSQSGDLANWMVPERGGGSVGGAMDLAAGAKRLVILMEHTARDGSPRLLSRCTYPLTAAACVDRIITNLGVFDIVPEGFLLQEIAPGISESEIRAHTDGNVMTTSTIRPMQL